MTPIAKINEPPAPGPERPRGDVCVGGTKAAQRVGIDHAKQNSDGAYLGRKPSYTREQFNKVRAVPGQQAVGIAQIARETG
jgi:hypothetical protein